jgi:UDP-N-acetyl-2-amino-2-deoxyglucuronate dehydrogenase
MLIGILGGGGISDTHARAARQIPGVEIAAVYSRNETKAARLAEIHGGRAYQDLSSFLNHRPMDFAIIGSPSALHAEHGIAAARQGLHVLVEKPIDISAGRADSLIAECAIAGVRLGVVFQDRAAPDLVKLKQILDANRLGTPILVSASVRWYRPPDYYGGSSWRGIKSLDGGGALMNQGVHTVDLLLWLLGNVNRVFATSATALHNIEVEDTIVATLEFANGAIGTLEAATSAYPGFPRRIAISGSEGSVVVEHNRITSLEIRDQPAAPGEAGGLQDAGGASSHLVADVSGHRAIIEDFIGAIQTGAAPCCDGAEGRRSVELVEAIYESARTGCAVEVTIPR